MSLSLKPQEQQAAKPAISSPKTLATHSLSLGEKPGSISEQEAKKEAIDQGVEIVTKILQEYPGASDIQFRTNQHIRVHTPFGLETISRWPKMSAEQVAGIALALRRAKAGARYEDKNGFQDEDQDFQQQLSEKMSLDFSCEGDVLFSVLPQGRLRCQAFLENNGLGLTARILRDEIMELDSLGFESEIAQELKTLVSGRSGIAFVTGQTGAGKSTTLAALVSHLQKAGRHIVTVEDPIEYRFREASEGLITQQEVGLHIASYRQGLRDALRKRPHVIMIGECRDRKTIETALEAAQTGHMVLTTLHTRSATEALRRITELFRQEDVGRILNQLSDSLCFILSQGLIAGAKGDHALNYELFKNNSSASKAAIGKYAENHTPLSDLLNQNGNVKWDRRLKSLMEKGAITRESYILNRLEVEDETVS